MKTEEEQKREKRQQDRQTAFTAHTKNVSTTLRGFFIATTVAYATIEASSVKSIGHINLFLIFTLLYFFLDFFQIAIGFSKNQYYLKNLEKGGAKCLHKIQLCLFIAKLIIFPIGFTIFWIFIFKAL